MSGYSGQRKILAAIGIILIAIIFIVIALKPLDSRKVIKNTASVSESNETNVVTTSATSEQSSTEKEPTDFPVNINTASVEELQKLPDIGAAKAAEIVAYREHNGNFQSKEELLNVYGIGESTLAEIYNYICL